MEISVRRLNHRLALQLPKELPLGLVFVSGTVEEVGSVQLADVVGHGRLSSIQFYLTEGICRLRCILSPKEAAHTVVQDGEQVRVGGHLMFDPNQASYFLLARDLEKVTETAVFELPSEDRETLHQEQKALAAALANVKKRAAVVKEPEADLPEWVQKIAPPEIQREDLPATSVPEADLLESAAVPLELDEELVEVLSDAMEQEAEVEVTPELLAQYHLQPPESTPLDSTDTEGEEENTAVLPPVKRPRYIRPPDHQETDWLVILLIIAFFIMALAMIIASVLLILQ